jgi:hypothetical protein
MPIVRLIAEDIITDDEVKTEHAWRPHKIGVIERTSKNAIVAWTPKIGEAVDDPQLSARLMVGAQEE